MLDNNSKLILAAIDFSHIQRRVRQINYLLEPVLNNHQAETGEHNSKGYQKTRNF